MIHLFEASQGKKRQRIVGADFLHGVEKVVYIHCGNHRLSIGSFNNQLQTFLCGKSHQFPHKLSRLAQRFVQFLSPKISCNIALLYRNCISLTQPVKANIPCSGSIVVYPFGGVTTMSPSRSPGRRRRFSAKGRSMTAKCNSRMRSILEANSANCFPSSQEFYAEVRN